VRLNELLRRETVGGALLVAAAVIALVWANSPWADAYTSVRDAEVGPAALHLHLSLGSWAADGLLAIFFFVAGLELKREFVAGDLRDVRRAALPVAAAVGGVATPALVYVLVNTLADAGDTGGWAIPAATDSAFALAVLAVIGRNLPVAFRTFLLTLAVVDDLLAIAIIAVFYTDDLDIIMLVLALLPIAAFGVLVQRRVRSWWLLLPLAAVAWGLVHASGIHATVAGVLLAFTVPVHRSDTAGGPDAGPGLAEHFEHRLRPLSAGVAVPIFALLSAGVAVHGASGLRDALSDPVALGVIAGLVVGKAVGITASTALVSRFTGARLADDLTWPDVVGLSLLGGIGFTVSLLIGELAYGTGSLRDEHVKIGVLTGSLLAIVLAAIVLRSRSRARR
jgi:Na+:H+ antiporter, NhaA family